MSDTLIRVENVSKKFCRSLKKSLWYGMQDLGREITGRCHGGDGELRTDEFWAVKDVSFELKRGECLGLIGHNGAGKTTLLRMLNGLITPDRGKIEIKGKVGALIALGAGFSPILTGRENVYVNASMLGIKKRKIDSKINEVIDFAEIGESIDSPVQTYSSGMHVRLGFAIAAVLLEPDILFLDEVLAVGDISFIIKCLNLVRELSRNAAVVFVSHNMQYVSTFCSRVIVLNSGKISLENQNPAAGIDCYFGMIKHNLQTSGSGTAQVQQFEILNNEKTQQGSEHCIVQGSPVTVILTCQLEDTVEAANVLLQINDISMNALISLPITGQDGTMLCILPGRHRLEIPLGIIDLNSGKYSFAVIIRESQTSIVLSRVQGLAPFRVFSPITHWGKIVRPITLNN